MDSYRIASELKFPNQIGATLNLEERYNYIQTTPSY